MIGISNCGRFATKKSDNEVNGVRCDDLTVRDQLHPYRNSRGNIVFNMLQAYAVTLKLTRGLWCDPVIDESGAVSKVSTGRGTGDYSAETRRCKFDIGGLFTTVSAKHLLFEGKSISFICYLCM